MLVFIVTLSTVEYLSLVRATILSALELYDRSFTFAESGTHLLPLCLSFQNSLRSHFQVDIGQNKLLFYLNNCNIIDSLQFKIIKYESIY